jgi:hypothetical protein
VNDNIQTSGTCVTAGPVAVTSPHREEVTAFFRPKRPRVAKQPMKGAQAAAALARRTKAKFEGLRRMSDATTVEGNEHLGAARPLFMSNNGETNLCDPINVQEICGDGHRTRKVYACGKRKCSSEVCLTHAVGERSRVLRKLMVPKDGTAPIFGCEWGVVVLPYPRAARDLLRWAHLLAASRKGAALLVQEWALNCNGLSYSEGWRLGLFSVDHPAGDIAPDEWKPHHNFLFPCLAFGPNGERRKLRYSVSREQLSELRALWKWWLESVVLGAPLGTKANVYYAFRQKRKQKAHAARYFPRNFPKWPGASKRCSWFGAFSCRSLNSLPEVQAAKAKEENPIPAGFCGHPNCGCEIVLTVTIGEDGIERLVAIPARYRVVGTS